MFVNLAPLSHAITAAALLPSGTLRDLEANLRWHAVTDHWLDDAEDCDPEGCALIDRADAIDLFLSVPGARVAALVAAHVYHGMEPVEALRHVCGADLVNRMISGVYDQMRLRPAPVF